MALGLTLGGRQSVFNCQSPTILYPASIPIKPIFDSESRALAPLAIPATCVYIRRSSIHKGSRESKNSRESLDSRHRPCLPATLLSLKLQPPHAP
jgi:hypothetical protein